MVQFQEICLVTKDFHRSPYGNDEVDKVEEVAEPLHDPVGPGGEPGQDIAEGCHQHHGAANHQEECGLKGFHWPSFEI